jgi:hypothetical protein
MKWGSILAISLLNNKNTLKPNINFLYEFNTPIGYLEMGYKTIDIPHIWEYLITSEFPTENTPTTIRFTSDGNYRKLSDTHGFFHYLKRDYISHPHNYNVNKLHYSHASLSSDIDYNFFSIIMSNSQSPIKFIDTNINSYFLPYTLQFIKENPTVKVIFNDIAEGAYEYKYSFFDNFYKFFINNNLSYNQLCFVTNSFNIEDLYNSYLKYRKLKSFMKVKTIPYYIYPTTGYALQTHPNCFIDKSTGIEYSYPTVDEIDLKRNKYYLNLNRNTGRLHRSKLVLHLINKNIKDKGLISFHKSKEFDIFCDIPENIEYKNKIQTEYPFILDQDDADVVSQMYNIFGNKKIWMDSYFSIVSETSVDKNHAFITEKTVKPIIYFHPFIIWGNPFSLKFLKEMGFQTFPEFFDESYDEVEDEDVRLSLIVDNVQRLCSKELDEIHDMYQSVKPKLWYNYNLLNQLYYDDKFINEFLKLWK